MKSIFLGLVILLATTFSSAGPVPVIKSQTYGIHLFFDESEFIDILTIHTLATGLQSGEMVVPNDFTGPIKNVKNEELKFSFDLFVPRNMSRPKDLVFHYEGQYFDATRTQMIGFVTIKDQPGFVASFTGFLRD